MTDRLIAAGGGILGGATVAALTFVYLFRTPRHRKGS